MKIQPLVELKDSRDLLVSLVTNSRKGWKKDFYIKKLAEYDEQKKKESKQV